MSTHFTSNVSPTLRVLQDDELDAVGGGFGKVVIVDCTTRPPVLNPGDVIWNPWLNPYPPMLPWV